MPENSILSPVSLTSFFDPATGQPKQASLFFYKAQTLDPITVYTDSVLHIPHAVPVVTTGWSRVPPVYVGEFPAPGYRVRAFDQWQTLIEDLDNLPGAPPDPSTVEPPTPIPPEAIYQTGDIKAMWSNHQAHIGWVECSGKTIGDIGSNATGMQSGDCHALFLHLWQQDPGTTDATAMLKVVGGKGPSAEGDWQAKKQIETPRAWGRMIGGADGYDAANLISVYGTLDDGLFDLLPLITELDKPYQPEDYIKAWMLGAHGGEDTHVLTKVELAVHFHDWIDKPGHSHYIDDPGHIHGVTQTPHIHGVVSSGAGSDSVVGRTTSGGVYGLNSVAGGPFMQVDMDIQAHSATFSIDNHTANLTLRNWWYASAGSGGYQETMMHVGTYAKKVTDGVPPDGDNQWHNATENYPRPFDWPVVADRGDKPHNNMPPFLLLCWYIKL